MPACAMELPPVEGRVKDGAWRCTRQRSPGNALLDNDLPRTVSPVVVRHARCVAYWCPSMAIADVWVFRIVHQDSGKPAQGVPVTVLDKGGNAAGHWVSDADGIVAVPRRDIPKLRLRVGMRYGALIEVEEYWQSLGVQWGELLYSATLTPGDEAKLAVLDGRWRREAEGRERPLQILARMVGTSMLGDLVSALRPELQLDALTLTEPGLEAAAADTVQMVRDRTERMSNALRRRPLGVVDAPAGARAPGAGRTVRNTTRDRLVTFHFFEPLERFKVMVRSPRARPVIFVPFRLPNVATPDVVRRFGYLFRRVLLDRGLLPDLERLLAGDDAGVPTEARGRLLEHVESNLLYYSTAIT